MPSKHHTFLIGYQKVILTINGSLLFSTHFTLQCTDLVTKTTRDIAAIKHSELMNIHEVIPIHLCLVSYQSVTGCLISSFVFAINESPGKVVDAPQ